MSVTIVQLTNLLEPYSDCSLECDGLTRVFSTLLQEEGIPHAVYVGNILHRGSGDSITHMWIELETEQGHQTIDYRARHWLVSSVVEEQHVPHGIFDQAQYPGVLYEGELVMLSRLPPKLFTFLTRPSTPLFESLSLASPVLYTLGYRQPYAEITLRFLVRQGFPLLDIRERAGSRFSPMYNRGRLEQRFKGQYRRIKELGNLNHSKKEAPVEFVDLEAGLAKSMQIINEDAAGRGVIYLCACENWPTCHRSQAATHLQEKIPDLTVVHIESQGSLVLQSAETVASASERKREYL